LDRDLGRDCAPPAMNPQVCLAILMQKHVFRQRNFFSEERHPPGLIFGRLPQDSEKEEENFHIASPDEGNVPQGETNRRTAKLSSFLGSQLLFLTLA
jgi:hypothetical protein